MKYLNINREHKYSTFLISLSVRLLLIDILLLLTLNIGFAKKNGDSKISRESAPLQQQGVPMRRGGDRQPLFLNFL